MLTHSFMWADPFTSLKPICITLLSLAYERAPIVIELLNNSDEMSLDLLQ